MHDNETNKQKYGKAITQIIPACGQHVAMFRWTGGGADLYVARPVEAFGLSRSGEAVAMVLDDDGHLSAVTTFANFARCLSLDVLMEGHRHRGGEMWEPWDWPDGASEEA